MATIKNLNYMIKGEDGITPIPNSGIGAKRPNMTFRDICNLSLLSPWYSDQGRPEEDKIKMEKYELHKKIRDAKEEVDLTIEEAALLKKWIGYWQPQLIMGQCNESNNINKRTSRQSQGEAWRIFGS